MTTWTKSSSKMNVQVAEYLKEEQEYALIIYRYKSHITGEFVNEWGVWEWKKDWFRVIDKKGITYGSLNDAKKAVEEAAKEVK